MLDRSLPPDIHPISKVKIKRADTIYLTNGIPLHIIDAGLHEIVKVEFLLRSGRWYENYPGISFFTAKMILEGTELRNSLEISEFFQSIGAHVLIDPGVDFVNISLYVLNKNLGKALPVLKECFIHATIPEKELTILKDIHIDQLRINKKKNSFVAGREIRKLLFGDDHPYGRSMEIDDIDKCIDRVSLLTFYREELLKGMEIIVSGKIDPGIIKGFDIFSDFGSASPQSRMYSPTSGKREKDIIRDESVQTSIRLARSSIPKNHPDHHGVVILNEILGGYFGSRLMKNLREEKGYTYGIYSTINHYLHEHYWIIGTDVRKQFRDAAISEIMHEFERLKNELISEKELTTVKNYILGSFISSLETSFSLANKFKSIHLFGLEYDYYDAYIGAINHCTAEQIRDLANTYLDISSFFLIKVG